MSEMSVSAYAKHVGVDRKTVSRWVRAETYVVLVGPVAIGAPAHTATLKLELE